MLFCFIITFCLLFVLRYSRLGFELPLNNIIMQSESLLNKLK